ncbi:Duplicated ATPase component YkoD of thiamin-regulated ECF transporter for HydroxyMethylPyrimidine [Paenibacillus pasadenensis]|uniref:Duplicated ATPase component YkoD of thiamin-regulated ECF transporter for HydroxyMethylPyrimidine n=1 Tax=Paenibacillus pasadenensis TaxID=217090 RepID=A0A2N5N0L8_9BACL|nr:ABC transporter ATP-binding protein [Paenibacillus pasadenensis]PLT43872.1 Duplicated ATPase component YkoD of thiamin-regulated ECF transporter for HydroxyMethylPyrimidine [Paenibacillus pasadenensis]
MSGLNRGAAAPGNEAESGNAEESGKAASQDAERAAAGSLRTEAAGAPARSGAAAVPVAAEAIGLRLKYPGEEAPLLFRDLDVTIRRGEKVLLLGPSGCGKSTLLQVLGGLVPSAIPIPLKAERLVVPERPGYVFQDPEAQFCMPYADEEIAFALENQAVPREQMPERIAACLEQAGLELPDPHTAVSELSQGMKQRLAVASMLAVDPDALLLDEPTALLDPEGTAQVWDALRRIWDGRTVLIVEHKIDLIAGDMDRILLFSPDGRLEADGPPEEIFRDCRAQLRRYGVWYPGFWDDEAAAKAGRFGSTDGGAHAGAAAPLDAADETHVLPHAPVPAGGGTLLAAAAAAPGADASAAAAPAAGTPPLPAPLLELDGFAGMRGREVKVRADRLSVCAGDWIAVTGANGAGKSTLLLAIMRLVRSEGRMRLLGAPEARLRKPRQAAELAAYCFQNPEFQLVTDSVAEELAFSMPERLSPPERDGRVRTLLERFALAGLERRHPYQLSMGQKRRLSVASAMACGQRLLLLDEPTFGLDAAGTVSMMEQLEELRRSGCAILMVTHDDELVRRFATRRWQVEQGVVRELPAPARPAPSSPPDDGASRRPGRGAAPASDHKPDYEPDHGADPAAEASPTGSPEAALARSVLPKGAPTR